MSKRFGRGVWCSGCNSGPHKWTPKFADRKRRTGRILCDRCWKRIGKKGQGENRRSAF